ncbi:MAG: CPXCG motif-containing cysteine-rich protein [Planctomycetales bacterium]|nr:CPXCG motif-containing cysteine-rich protein [Planctomycetales bacterium]NIM09304.1 CPXCG motif-containing cysteine-rich protein [Planctomycetales bacterium]NIN08772.1 CPXCG motif-containing cysteine-rich protein [Planctomycetales bacterium]NIN77889.1 CPXCG motif-containing cysteine-rich protein [Planctomycetales bacterium]NIO35072.1 CPXCG motif-containing cysteine-rich protein [Planctomycetales bacterium]
MHDEAAYLCDACGEEIVIPVDLSQGSHQQYVEDCPVCCRPQVIHVQLDASGQLSVWAEPE